MIKQTISGLSLVLAMVLLGGCITPEQIAPSKEDYGLAVSSAYNGNAITIGAQTEALEYNGRIFYFKDKTDLDLFMENPTLYIQKYEFNESPVVCAPLASDYGLKTNDSYNSLPIVITNYTPTLRYLGRIYYFAHKETMEHFMKNPEVYIAKFPANKPPKIISPLKSDYGTKSDCAATGTPLLIGPHTPTLEYIGRVFYFSNLNGMNQFREDPQAFIVKKFNRE